ncbi:MAG: SGNH/GDSL hydrolase family protein [Proteobacteria bacterium]|nr:SGNH/GDSL hydrolase family protein [Pseudomonadota bacterium]
MVAAGIAAAALALTAPAAAVAPTLSGSQACVGGLCGVTSLAPFFKAIADDQTSHRGRPVHVLIIGDSHSASDNIWGALRNPLQARSGYGGRGVLPAGKPYLGFLPQGVHIDQTEGWTVQSVLRDADPGHPFGLSGFRLTANHDGAGLTLTAEPSQSFNRLVVCARDAPGAGTLLVDFGPTQSRVSLSAQAPGEVCTAFQVKDQASRASLTTEGPVTLTSWATFNDAGGVAVSNLGVVGATLADFARTNDGAVAEELRAYQPDLIVLEFGTNDGFVGRFDGAAFEALLHAQIQRVRKLSGGAPILIVGAPDANSNRPGQRANAEGYAADTDPGGGPWYSPPGLRAVRAIQSRVASEEGVAYWDWAGRMGGPGYAQAWPHATPPLMRGDHVHYTLAGGARIAAALLEDLDKAAAAIPPLPMRPEQ